MREEKDTDYKQKQKHVSKGYEIISVYIDEKMLEKIDEKRDDKSRSLFIRNILEEYFKE